MFDLKGKILIFLMINLSLASCLSRHSNPADSDAPKVERGRLKFAKGVTYLGTGKDAPIYRNVTQQFFVNDKKWSPKDDKDLADRIGWCDTSPNPQVEILRCLGDVTENYSTTYILRMKGDEVELQKLNEGGGSVWINDEGRWLLQRKFFVNVETGETIAVKGMPWADDKNASAPVTYVLAVSPDMKTVVICKDKLASEEKNEKFLKLEILDIETGKIEIYRASATKNPWLNDWENPTGDIQPPPAPSKKFIWKKDTKGRDKIVVPELLEFKK